MNSTPLMNCTFKFVFLSPANVPAVLFFFLPSYLSFFLSLQSRTELRNSIENDYFPIVPSRWISFGETSRVPILDGNSEHVAHARMSFRWKIRFVTAASSNVLNRSNYRDCLVTIYYKYHGYNHLYLLLSLTYFTDFQLAVHRSEVIDKYGRSETDEWTNRPKV